MKKIFTIIFAVCFMASTVYAVDIETSGKFEVRGSYISNEDGLQGGDTDAVSYGYYDSELDMNVDLVVSEATKIMLNFEAHDENWMQSGTDGAAVSGEVTDNGDGTYSFDGDDLDDNIEIKRLYGTHTFTTGTIFEAGLMEGYAFGTDFGNSANGAWILSVAHPLAGIDGTVGLNIQKDTEMGKENSTTEDAEKDDSDSYYLWGSFNMAGHTIMPRLAYYNDSAYVEDNDDDGMKTMEITLAAEGTMGPLGYEAEVEYSDNTTDVESEEDYSLYGVYANLWTEMGNTTLGGLIAYGSYDDDAGVGYGFGEDFTPTMFGADFTEVGATGLSEYNAVTLIQLYGEMTMSEALSLFANGTYWMSNSDGNMWEDATGYEIDLGGAYKITENVKYDVLAAYGQFELDEDAAAGSDDTDAFYRLFHRFTINF
ncbi:MAG: hypothetical protein PVI90_12745 [Desulfobacteraceae bacterium]|jgi:hypothetical protein